MNEVDNIIPISEEITKQMSFLPQYNYEIIFSDNCSTDGTQEKLRYICSKDKRIKAILNAKNFPETSAFNVMYSAHGDCVIYIPSDFQVPVSIIPEMLKKWEEGATVVAPIKTSSKENKLMLLIRKMYYLVAKSLSENNTLPGYTGSGLYDKSFITLCKDRMDPCVDFRTMINEYAVNLQTIEYIEEKRRFGKSKGNFLSLLQTGIFRIISNSSVIPHYTIFGGVIIGIISIFVACYYFIMKLIFWNSFSIGMAPLVVGVFFIGSIQLFFIGFIGEYIINLNNRIRKQDLPLVIEKERLNFDDQNET